MMIKQIPYANTIGRKMFPIQMKRSTNKGKLWGNGSMPSLFFMTVGHHMKFWWNRRVAGNSFDSMVPYNTSQKEKMLTKAMLKQNKTKQNKTKQNNPNIKLLLSGITVVSIYNW